MRAPIPLAEKAFLTYQAMSNSDDLVLLLEHGDSAATDDAFVIGLNDAFRRASGFPGDQLLGCTVADLFPGGSDAETLMTAIRGCSPLRSELACRRADGDSFMLGMHLMPAPARTQGKACFVLLGRDITTMLQARHMQEAVQRLLAKVFSSVDAAVAIVNAGGRIVMTNRGIDLLLGYKPNELVGRSSLELVASGSRAAVATTVKRQFEADTDAVYSVQVVRADGDSFMLGMHLMPAPARTQGKACFVQSVFSPPWRKPQRQTGTPREKACLSRSNRNARGRNRSRHRRR
jgi:PAS domain S-box-containing protein